MRVLDIILEIAVAALIVAATAVGFTEVIFRYLLGSSIGWSFEFLQIILVYITFVGGFLASRKRGHLRVTVLVEKMPRTLRMICFLLAQIGIAITTVVMTIWGWDYAFRFPDTTTDMIRIPVVYLYIIVPLCGFAMSCQVVCDIVIGLRNYLSGDEPEKFGISLPGFDDIEEPAGARS
ncbi:TRAP transporter small permease [Roseovarius sp. Pro17]|uniref:TRAP transporter small permease n=1 Tax=Roseovarius sp. Pro17 TaxID=3108175 RepID=UPI002D780A39|nr:TRAP transporter small permease [Roseovarius sp. Pro17]